MLFKDIIEIAKKTEIKETGEYHKNIKFQNSFSDDGKKPYGDLNFQDLAYITIDSNNIDANIEFSQTKNDDECFADSDAESLRALAEGIDLSVSINKEETILVKVINSIAKLNVSIEKNVTAKIILLHEGTSEFHLNVSCETDSNLVINEIQNTTERLFVWKTISLEKNSALKWVSLDVGGELIRNCIDASIIGENAEIELLSATNLSSNKQSHNLLKISHNVENTKSTQLFKCIADDDSIYSFDGLVHISENADGTDAAQKSANFQLSDNAKIYARPRLDVHTDEVSATHGATIGSPDEEEIYYLRTRGLDEKIAKEMVTKGFLNDVSNKCFYRDFLK